MGGGGLLGMGAVRGRISALPVGSARSMYLCVVCGGWVSFYFACRDEHRLLSFSLLARRRFYLFNVESRSDRGLLIPAACQGEHLAVSFAPLLSTAGSPQRLAVVGRVCLQSLIHWLLLEESTKDRTSVPFLSWELRDMDMCTHALG